MIRRRSSAYIRTGGSIRGYAPQSPQRRRRRPWGVVPLGGPSRQNVGISTNRGLRFRTRSGSMTRPRKYGGTPTQKVMPTSAGSSMSYFKTNYKPSPGSKIMKRIHSAQYKIFNSGSRFTSTQGQQASIAFQVSNTAKLIDILEATFGTYATDSFCFVDDALVTTTFQNQSEANTFLHIYEFVARQDSVQGPANSFTNGITSIGLTSSDNAQDIGVTPYMSPRFVNSYKICKKYTVELAQGRSHVHKSVYNYRKKLESSRFNNNPDAVALAGWTRGLFCIAYGSPFNSLADSTKVSTTPVALDIVQSIKYSYHYDNVNKSSFMVESDFPTFSDGRILDIGSGEVESLDAA